jgi:hypothetical protein
MPRYQASRLRPRRLPQNNRPRGRHRTTELEAARRTETEAATEQPRPRPPQNNRAAKRRQNKAHDVSRGSEAKLNASPVGANDGVTGQDVENSAPVLLIALDTICRATLLTAPTYGSTFQLPRSSKLTPEPGQYGRETGIRGDTRPPVSGRHAHR